MTKLNCLICSEDDPMLLQCKRTEENFNMFSCRNCRTVVVNAVMTDEEFKLVFAKIAIEIGVGEPYKN